MKKIIHITGITERLERDEVQVLFEEIMTEKLPKLLRYQTTHSQVQKTLNKINI